MKKILYSLMAIGGLFATSCATFDDPVTENYGEGPKVTITVTETTDSTFTFQVNAEGALYYSVLVDQSTEVASLDATSLYKGSYSSTFAKAAISAKDNATYTYNMRDAKGNPLCKPNTTYQIYAVAGSEKGIIGEIAVAEVTTTDANAPKPTQYQYDPDSKVMYVAFNENIVRGEGAVTAKVYKYMDLMNGTVNPEAVPAEEIVVKTSGNQIAIAVPTTYAGAYVTFSWEAGAFVDSYGNACGALNSGFSSAAGDFVGLYGRNTKEAFAVTEANVTEPELGTSFGDWTAFFAAFTFEGNVYANTNEAGAVTVTYSNSVSEKSIKLTSEEWATEENQFMFILPQAPEFGDYVSVKVAEGTFIDAYGNPNAEVEFADAWLVSYGYTRDMVIGNYTIAYQSGYDEEVYTLSSSIEADPDSENGVILNGLVDLFDEGTGAGKIKGTFDGDFGTITFPCGQVILEGIQMSDGSEVYVKLEEYNGLSNVTFQVQNEGAYLACEDWWGYRAYNAADNSSPGYFEVAVVSMAQKSASTESAAASISKKSVKSLGTKKLCALKK